MSTPDPIEMYMARFDRFLAIPPSRRRRVLEEVESHLRDAAKAYVDSGASPEEAQQRAVADFGPSEAAAGQFDSSLLGLACRYARRFGRWLQGRNAGAENASDRPAPGSGGSPSQRIGSSPSPTCDVCGGTVDSGDKIVADVSAVGEIESPVTLVVHPACYDLGTAALALSGMPVTADPPRPRRRVWEA